MKELKNILEGLLDQDFADKDMPSLDLIESAFNGFYADGMARAFAEFKSYVLEIECSNIYVPRINDALRPILKELEQYKNIPICGYILKELGGTSEQIIKRLSHSRTDIPDYAERVLKMVSVAHDLDSLLNKLSAKYKRGTINDICARLNVRNKKIIFEIASKIVGNTDKAVAAIEKQFSGMLDDDVRVVYDGDGNEELDIIINI